MIFAILLAVTCSPTDHLKVGDKAPDFTLPFATKDTISHAGVTLSDLVGRSTIVLAFYPADWSGGCTKELCTMRDNFDFLTELGVTVLGISGDYVFSHHEWAKHHNFQFALLSDHRHHVAEAYGSFDSLRGFNRRTVYVIDRGGRIAYIDLGYNANSEESFDQLRNALKHVQ